MATTKSLEDPALQTEEKFGLGFVSLENEVSIDNLPVKGKIPPWLTGTLLRNGPAKFEVGTRSFNHWFDGLAMLHKFSFKEGTASYANRFLQSNAYKTARETGKITYPEFATDPCRSIFSRLQTLFSPQFTDNANVNVTRMGERFIAMTETPLPIHFDSQTLGTIGVLHNGYRDLGQVTTAHPHYDFGRREAINYIVSFSPFGNEYRVFRIPSGGVKGDIIGSRKVSEPSYMHSFAMTENFVVLAEYPLVVQLSDLLLSGKPFIENYRWSPERGARFIVMDRQNGKVAGTYETDAFFAFHHVNSFEREGEIVLDLVAYSDSSIIESLYLKVLRGESPGTIQIGELRRYTIPLGDKQVTYEVLSDQAIELPRIHYRLHNTRDYRFVYGIGGYGRHSFGGKLLKIDVRDRTFKAWSEKDCYTGEPVFVPEQGAVDEDGGVILSVVLDSGRGNSFLLVLNARSFEEIARAEVPHHIPFGFHGQFYGDVS